MISHSGAHRGRAEHAVGPARFLRVRRVGATRRLRAAGRGFAGFALPFPRVRRGGAMAKEVFEESDPEHRPDHDIATMIAMTTTPQ